MLEKIRGFIYTISMAVIPMLFGSFLFVGILENYKNSESLNTIILDSYKTLRSKHSECHRIHNKLFLSYYPYAGTFKIMAAEIERVVQTKGIELPKEYELLLLSNVESQSKQGGNIDDLEKKKSDCYWELYINYEELALLLDRLEDFERIAEQRASSLNGFNDSIKEAQSKLKSVSADDLWNVFRQGIEHTISSGIEKWILGMEELYELQVALAGIEEEKFDIESRTFTELRMMYLVEIRSRLNRSFVDYLFQ